MAQGIEDSGTFPLQVKRTADGLYTVESAWLGIGKTGKNLAEVEALVRTVVAEILMIVERHGLEKTCGSVAVVQTHTAAKENEPRVYSIENHIMRWAKIALVIFILSLVIAQGAKQMIMSKLGFLSSAFEISSTIPEISSALPGASDSAHVYAKGAAKIVAKTAQVLESVTPDRRNEVANNLHRIAIALQPYVAQMRPLWMACCDPQTDPYLVSNGQGKVKERPVSTSKE